MTDALYQFENYILDVKKRRLLRDGKVVNIDVRTIDLLVCLIQASPKWVDKNDLRDKLWPDQEITDWALSRLVSDTRKLLGDDGDAQRIIRTIRGRGFQFYEDFKRLGPSGSRLTEGESDDPPTPPVSQSGLLKYLAWGAVVLMVIGLTYFSDTPANKPDVTALINLSVSEDPRLNDILEDWALSQEDMILIKNSDHDRNVSNIDLFRHYCGDDKCSQLIMITVQKSNKAMSLRYQVMSDGRRQEERELISTNRDFLISALCDAVAGTMNRSSDHFALPSAMFMDYPDELYRDMYRIHVNLENTYVTFLAQARRRDELVALITKRLHVKRTRQYEKFFMIYFDRMDKEEKFIFDQIRAMTSGTLYQGNRNMLTLLESSPALTREIPKFKNVRKHLAFWIEKYQNIFLERDDMSLLYVGVEDAVPFPSGIDSQVSEWLKSHQ